MDNFKKLENIEFVLFDMIGTTVRDINGEGSLIVQSFKQAFTVNHLDIQHIDINTQRGKSKRVAIQSIVDELGIPEHLTDKIYNDFLNLLDHSIHHFSAMDHAVQIFNWLTSKGIEIGIGSGLPLSIIEHIIKHLGWEANNFAYLNSSDELDAGRPDPIMILDAMKIIGIKNPNKVLKIGDTLVDVLEGKNASVHTAMVLTGTQTIEHLADIRPDFILNSIKELPEILNC